METHRLYLVVAHAHRAGLLRDKMPAELQQVTDVLHFPILERPSQLANLRELLGSFFDRLRASRFPSRSEDEAITGAFLLALAEHQPDGEGYCVVSEVLGTIHGRSLARIRRQVAVAHPRWAEAQAILQGIDGLECWADRGYFEWRFRGVESALIGPVDGDQFNRFVNRIVAGHPKTFDDFEGVLP